MKIELNNTSTKDIASRLKKLSVERGDTATDRVLTLIMVAGVTDDVSTALDSLSAAVAEHPARIIVVIKDELNSSKSNGAYSLDATLEVGMSVGAAEIISLTLHGEMAQNPASIVIPFLLPDTPIVAWWPFQVPQNLADDEIGRIATRRITDSSLRPQCIAEHSSKYAPGDTDLIWSRITPWRGMVAASVEQLPQEDILSAEIIGMDADPSADIAAGWLASCLKAPVTLKRQITPTTQQPSPSDHMNTALPLGVLQLTLERPSTTIVLRSISPEHIDQTITVKATGETTVYPQRIHPRTLSDCMAEELRHLEEDKTYGDALSGIHAVTYVEK